MLKLGYVNVFDIKWVSSSIYFLLSVVLFIFHSKFIVLSFLFLLYFFTPLLFNLTIFIFIFYFIRNIYISKYRLDIYTNPKQDIENCFIKDGYGDGIYIYLASFVKEFFSNSAMKKNISQYIYIALFGYLMRKYRYTYEFALMLHSFFILFICSIFLIIYSAIFGDVDICVYSIMMLIIGLNVYTIYNKYILFLDNDRIGKLFVSQGLKGEVLFDRYIFFYKNSDNSIEDIEVEFSDVEFEFGMVGSVVVAFMLSYLYFFIGVLKDV